MEPYGQFSFIMMELVKAEPVHQKDTTIISVVQTFAVTLFVCEINSVVHGMCVTKFHCMSKYPFFIMSIESPLACCKQFTNAEIAVLHFVFARADLLYM